MKLKVTIISFALTLFMVAGASAQITINSGDINTTFGTTNTFYTVADTTGNGITVDLGTSGGGQTWTFNETLFPGGSTTSQTIVDPAPTPFSSLFPTATFAFFDSSPEDTTDFWSYGSVTSSEFRLLGGGFQSPSDTLSTVFDPSELLAVFPLTEGTTFTGTHTLTVEAFGALTVTETVKNAEVDGYGTLVLPLGSFDCLRLREVRTTFSTVTFGGQVIFQDTTQNILYNFIVGGSVGIGATVTGLVGDTNPNFTAATSVSFSTGAVTAIEESEETIARGFELEQNYPNPFNPSTTIRYSLLEGADVILDVYNLAGQKVATLVNGRQSAGTHNVTFDASDLSSGVYFYRLALDNGNEQVRRMILMK